MAFPNKWGVKRSFAPKLNAVKKPAPKTPKPFKPGKYVAPPANPNPAENAPLPWDARYESDTSANTLAFEQGQSRLGMQRANMEQSYGFDNPADPFSRMGLLQKSYENDRQSTTTNTAAAGRFYDGSTSDQRDIDRTGFNAQHDALRKAYLSEQAGMNQEKIELEQNRNQGNIDAQAGRLERALEAPQDPEESDPGKYMKRPGFYQKRLAQLNKNKGDYRAKGLRIRQDQLRNQQKRAVQEWGGYLPSKAPKKKGKK